MLSNNTERAKKIRARAKDYVLSGNISITKISEDEYKFSNKEFIARIELRSGEVSHKECGCVRFTETGNCIHIEGSKFLLQSLIASDKKSKQGKRRRVILSDFEKARIYEELARNDSKVNTFTQLVSSLLDPSLDPEEGRTILKKYFTLPIRVRLQDVRSQNKDLKALLSLFDKLPQLPDADVYWQIHRIFLELLLKKNRYEQSINGQKAMNKTHKNIMQLLVQELAPELRYRIFHELDELFINGYNYIEPINLFHIYKVYNKMLPEESIPDYVELVISEESFTPGLLDLILASLNHYELEIPQSLLKDSVLGVLTEDTVINSINYFLLLAKQDTEVSTTIRKFLLSRSADNKEITKCINSQEWLKKIQKSLSFDSEKLLELSMHEVEELLLFAMIKNKEKSLEKLLYIDPLLTIKTISSSEDFIVRYWNRLISCTEKYLERHAGLIPIKEVLQISRRISKNTEMNRGLQYVHLMQERFPEREISNFFSV